MPKPINQPNSTLGEMFFIYQPRRTCSIFISAIPLVEPTDNKQPPTAVEKAMTSQ